LAINVYPNPSAGMIHITYNSQVTNHIQLSIYDIQGRKIITLINQKELVGEYTKKFDATNLPAGIYFVRLIAGDIIETKKIVVISPGG
jgi:hypothetical protein